ncbi:gamma carbonic anhydrase family protein [Fibrobacterota bacterium]
MTVKSWCNMSPQLGERVYIDPNALVLGDVVIGDDSSVWPMASVRGDVAKISIGSETNIQDGCSLHCNIDSRFFPGGSTLTVGDLVTVGHQATLHGCTLGDRVLIGMGATVLDGVIIAPDVLLGANSLVLPNTKLESGFLYAGNPARKIRKLTDEEWDFLPYSSQSYRELKDKYLNGA